METPSSRQFPGPSPVRSRSTGGPPMSPPPKTLKCNSSSSQIHRSKSISRTQKSTVDGKNGFAKSFWQTNTSSSDAKKRTPPSAWALSPGRYSLSSACPILPKSPAGGTRRLEMELRGGGGGGVVGVLNYFRKQKVSAMEKEEYHQLCVAHNRLLQWRFVNARANTTLANQKKIAEKKLFNVWLKILMLRQTNTGKKIDLQRYLLVIRLLQIIKPQFFLLKEWAKLERKNSEAVGRLAEKLSAISIKLPLVDGAKADLPSVCDSVIYLTGVMNSIEENVMKFYSQAEKICYMLMELIITIKQEIEHMKKMENWINLISSLEVKEKSLRLHIIQLAKESNRGKEGG